MQVQTAQAMRSQRGGTACIGLDTTDPIQVQYMFCDMLIFEPRLCDIIKPFQQQNNQSSDKKTEWKECCLHEGTVAG